MKVSRYNALRKVVKKATKAAKAKKAAAKARKPARLIRRVPRKSGIAPVTKVRGSVGGLSTSLCVRKTRPSPQVLALERVGAPNIFTNTYAFRINQLPGYQGVCSFAFNDLNALDTLPASIGMPGWTGNKPFRYVVESLISNVTMTNNSTAAVELEIYDIVLRRDLPDPIQLHQGSQSWALPASACYPDIVWNYFSNMDNGNAPSITPPYPSNYPGASPFDCTIWKNYFKVTKRTHVLLPQGGSHRHGVIAHPNRLIDSTMFNQAYQDGVPPTSSLAGLQGLTTYVMVVQKGLPVSTNDGVPENAGVTLAGNSVDYVQDFRYKYTYVVDNVMTSRNVHNMLTPLVTSIVNIGSGAVEAQDYTKQT